MLSDLVLSRRLEMTEALANARFVETRRKLQPESGACWMEKAGSYAMFDGVSSPLTQTFGLGIERLPTDDELTEIEQFFIGREAAVYHEVSPMVPMEILSLLSGRGYRPIELTNVLYRTLDAGIEKLNTETPFFEVREIADGEEELWANVSADGWNLPPEFDVFIRGFGKAMANTTGSHPMIALYDGLPVATGGLFLGDGIALLAGASTIPSARKKGAQSALLAARLQLAQQKGCDIAMMCAQPGTPSQRNAQRNGFCIAYTRIKWQLFETTTAIEDVQLGIAST